MTPEKKNLLELFIHVLMCEAQEQGYTLKKIHIIKYIYLLDVYMAQENGQQFTDFIWEFIHYGPYDNGQSEKILDNMVKENILTLDVKEGKYGDYNVYKPRTCVKRGVLWHKELLPNVLQKLLDKDLRRYGDNTYFLLDYVYFHTEPMSNAKPKQILNFINLEKDVFFEDMKIEVSKTKLKKFKDFVEQSRKNKQKTFNKINLFPTFHDNLLEEFDKTFFKDIAITDFSGEACIKNV